MLTYAQCDVDKEVMKQYLLGLLGEAKVLYLVVCEEEHQDEGKHLHAYVMMLQRWTKKNAARFFDFAGFHPHYQGQFNPIKSADYVKKDGVWVEWGIPPNDRIDLFFDRYYRVT